MLNWLSRIKHTIDEKKMQASKNFYDFCQKIFYDRPAHYIHSIFQSLISNLTFLFHPKQFFQTNMRQFINRMLEEQEFANRVISSILLTSICLPLIIIGGWALQILVLAVTVTAAWEWAKLNPGAVFSLERNLLVGFIGIALLLMKPLGPAAPALIAVFIFLDNFIPRLSKDKLFHNQLGFTYLFVAALSFIWIHDYFGALAALWLVLTVIATDVAAYVGGKAFQGKKLMPDISPGKTISGAVCGLIAAGAVGLGYSFITDKPLMFFMLLSLLTSILAQGGDLFESMLKRRANVKNSGTLIPGHGGVLDRIDGFLMASPAAFLVLQIVELLN